MEKRLYNFIATITFLLISSELLMAQGKSLTVVDETNTIKLLSVRPNMVIGVAPITGDFAADVRLDAQYWYKDKFDARFGTSGGVLNCVSFGGTYHLQDKMVSKAHKFIVSETDKQRTYYRHNANVRRVFGPAADARIGYVLTSNKAKLFYTELDLGVDYQVFSRNYADIGEESYPSNKNGWYSIKFQGILAVGGKQFAAGFAGTMGAARRPWKGVTMYLSMSLGVLKTFGGSLNPIISPGFGVSINLIKPKN